MIVRQCDPGQMSPEARLGEIACLLVRGIRRFEAMRQKDLDAEGALERACAHAAVDARENPKE